MDIKQEDLKTKKTHFLRAILLIILSSIIGYNFIKSFSTIPNNEQSKGDPIALILFSVFIVGWWFLIDSIVALVKNHRSK